MKTVIYILVLLVLVGVIVWLYVVLGDVGPLPLGDVWDFRGIDW